MKRFWIAAMLSEKTSDGCSMNRPYPSRLKISKIVSGTVERHSSDSTCTTKPSARRLLQRVKTRSGSLQPRDVLARAA
jgi:hypothetical protein